MPDLVKRLNPDLVKRLNEIFQNEDIKENLEMVCEALPKGSRQRGVTSNMIKYLEQMLDGGYDLDSKELDCVKTMTSYLKVIGVIRPEDYAITAIILATAQYSWLWTEWIAENGTDGAGLM